MQSQPIGVFDSGVGGLTILKELRRTLPHESFIYFGDTLNVPYGGKSKAVVTRLSVAVARFLQQQSVKLIVVACNTVSAQALPVLRRQMQVPVLGVIQPGAQCAARTTRNGKIAVLGTQGTVHSKAYVKAIGKLDRRLSVYQQACPLFATLVEEGFAASKATELIARQYLQGVQESQADTVILGCTHYPVLKPVLAHILGPRISLVDSAETLAQAVREYLHRNQAENRSGRGSLKLYASDAPVKFTQAAQRILGEKPPRAVLKKLSYEDLCR